MSYECTDSLGHIGNFALNFAFGSELAFRAQTCLSRSSISTNVSIDTFGYLLIDVLIKNDLEDRLCGWRSLKSLGGK